MARAGQSTRGTGAGYKNLCPEGYEVADVSLKSDDEGGKEVRILVPGRILERAKLMAANGLYSEALDLLNRNKMEFEINGDFMKLRMPGETKRQYHFSKRKLT